MADGLEATVANAILDALVRSVAWTDPVAFYVKLHTASPGAAGTTAPATETTRKLPTYSAAASGAITNSGAVSWTNYPAAETITHVSFWDAVTAGAFLGSKQLTVARTPAIGDTVTLAIGDLDLSLAVAS